MTVLGCEGPIDPRTFGQIVTQTVQQFRDGGVKNFDAPGIVYGSATLDDYLRELCETAATQFVSRADAECYVAQNGITHFYFASFD